MSVVLTTQEVTFDLLPEPKIDKLREEEIGNLDPHVTAEEYIKQLGVYPEMLNGKTILMLNIGGNGEFYPLLAVAKILKNRYGANITMVIPDDPQFIKAVQEAGIDYKVVPGFSMKPVTDAMADGGQLAMLRKLKQTAPELIQFMHDLIQLYGKDLPHSIITCTPANFALSLYLQWTGLSKRSINIDPYLMGDRRIWEYGPTTVNVITDNWMQLSGNITNLALNNAISRMYNLFTHRGVRSETERILGGTGSSRGIGTHPYPLNIFADDPFNRVNVLRRINAAFTPRILGNSSENEPTEVINFIHLHRQSYPKGVGENGVILFSTGSTSSDLGSQQKIFRALVRFSLANPKVATVAVNNYGYTTEQLLVGSDISIERLPENFLWTEKFNIQAVIPLSDGVFFNGGAGLAAATIVHGVPSAGIPTVPEQYRNLIQNSLLGLGLMPMAMKDFSAESYAEEVSKLIKYQLKQYDERLIPSPSSGADVTAAMVAKHVHGMEYLES